MHGARHITLAISGGRKSTRKRTLLLAAALLSLAVLAFLLASVEWSLIGKRSQSKGQVLDANQSLAAVSPPNLLRLVPPEVALEENAIRPFSTRPDQPAASFRAGRVKEADLARAIECLAQAIYYEAGGEGADGERAVAQVVLNRVRHPGFPPSVCGTVYQGADRATGCQFTFTCDGSLLRLPAGPLWTRARRLARDALVSGYVFGPIGHATHYHADYVLPYWADSLEKETRIGRHLFYRLPGILGTAAAFAQHYSRNEPVPPSPSAAKVAAEAIQGVVDDQAANDPLGAIVGSRPAESPLPPALPLMADETAGSLITPYASQIVAGPVWKKPDCAPATGSRQIKPAAANNVRSNSHSTTC